MGGTANVHLSVGAVLLHSRVKLLILPISSTYTPLTVSVPFNMVLKRNSVFYCTCLSTNSLLTIHLPTFYVIPSETVSRHSSVQ
jgi:hypothetical protein